MPLGTNVNQENLLFVEGCSGIWGTLLPSSESSSASSSCGSELLVGLHEIFVEFNMKISNWGGGYWHGSAAWVSFHVPCGLRP